MTKALEITKKLANENGWELDEEEVKKVADWAYMATQYASYGEGSIDNVIEHLANEKLCDLEDDDEALIDFVLSNDILSDDDETYNMDEFDDVIDGYTPTQIANSIHFGNFNPTDDYFGFDGYGNLKSWQDWELANQFKDYYKDEILDLLKQEVESDEDGEMLEYAGIVCDELVKAGY